MSQSPSPGEMGDSCLKPHLHMSAQAEVFITRERGTEQRSREGVARFSPCRRAQTSTAHSDKSTVRHPGLVILASRRPGSMVEGQQISQSCDT